MSEDLSIEYDNLDIETDLAIRIRIDKELHWLPKSQIRVYKKNQKVYVPKWLAKDKGLI